MKKYIDAGQSCNECGSQFILRVYNDGTYEYLTNPCDCEGGFSPCDGELSISQIFDTLQPLNIK